MQLYHATSHAAAEQIKQSRTFQCGSHGFAGGGIYFSKSKDAACRKCFNGRGTPDVVIQCRVELGRSCTAQPYEVDKDACFAKGCDSVKIDGHDVYAVYDPSRVSIRRFDEPPPREPHRASSAPPLRTSSGRSLGSSDQANPPQQMIKGKGKGNGECKGKGKNTHKDQGPSPQEKPLSASHQQQTPRGELLGLHHVVLASSAPPQPGHKSLDQVYGASWDRLQGFQGSWQTISSVSPAARPSYPSYTLPSPSLSSTISHQHPSLSQEKSCWDGRLWKLLSCTRASFACLGIGWMGVMLIRLPFASSLEYGTLEHFNCITLGMATIIIGFLCLANCVLSTYVAEDESVYPSAEQWHRLCHHLCDCTWFVILLVVCVLSLLAVLLGLTAKHGVQNTTSQFVTVIVVLQLFGCCCQSCLSTGRLFKDEPGLWDEELGLWYDNHEFQSNPRRTCCSHVLAALVCICWGLVWYGVASSAYKYPEQFLRFGQLHVGIQGLFIILVAIVAFADNVYRMGWVETSFKFVGVLSGRSWLHGLMGMCMLSTLNLFQLLQRENGAPITFVVIVVATALGQLLFIIVQCCGAVSKVVKQNEAD